eukprot:COSAG01_NODE_1443_length_10286_cov_7.093649_17_plen_89_part_00
MRGAFQSLTRSILTEIYLCHACSCQEIEDGNARAGTWASIASAELLAVLQAGLLALAWCEPLARLGQALLLGVVAGWMVNHGLLLPLL